MAIFYPTALRRVQITPKTSTNIKQLLDEVEHDIMRKPNSIIVLLYIFHIIHPQKQKRKILNFLKRRVKDLTKYFETISPNCF